MNLLASNTVRAYSGLSQRSSKDKVSFTIVMVHQKRHASEYTVMLSAAGLADGNV